MLKGENYLQMQCCRILDLAKLLYFAIPNGTNKQSWQTQWLFKVTGLKSGVPDLMIAEPFIIEDSKKTLLEQHHCGMFIEFKDGKNKPTDNQLEWINKLRGKGYFCAIVYTTEQFIDLLKLYYTNQINHIKF